MDYSKFFKYYEAKNKSIPENKDYERIADIFKFERDKQTAVEKMAKLVKDKFKAIRRGVACELLSGADSSRFIINVEKNWNNDLYLNSFIAKAKELGASLEEVINAFNFAYSEGRYLSYKNDIESYKKNISNEEYINSDGEVATRRSNGSWLNPLNKNLTKAGIPFKYTDSKVGIMDKKGKVASNGRKWAEGVKLILWPGEEKEVTLTIDILTDEGGGTTLFDVINKEIPSGKRLKFETNKSGYVSLSELFKAIQTYKDKF